MTSLKALFLSIAVGTIFCSGATAQEDTLSANYYLEACRLYANNVRPQPGVDQFKMPLCAGVLLTLAWAAPQLGSSQLQACPPSAATKGQVAKVVVAYLDQHPARLHEQFVDLALEALRHAWPCPKG